jgi:hypothetical protein
MHAPRPLLVAAAALAALLVATPRPLGAAPAAAPARVALDAYLKGAITTFDGSSVEVRYDLADPAQMEDFPTHKAFQIKDDIRKTWLDKNMVVEGTGSLVWKPILRRKCEMEFSLKMRVMRDFGAYIAEERPTDEMTVFSVYDQYFQNKDHPGSQKVHMICRFTMHAQDAGGDFAFRYVIRKPGPLVEANKAVRVRLGKEGVDEWMEIDGQKMQGSENQWPPLRGYRPGFYVISSGAQVSDIVMRGEIDPAWAEEAGVDLALPVKIKAPARPAAREATEADKAAEQKIQAVRSGAEAPATVLRLIEDPALLDSTRDDAAKAVEEANDLRLVPRLVQPMESPDALTRRLAGRIVARLTGKTFGYSADAPEDARHRAVRSLLDWIEKNPGKVK